MKKNKMITMASGIVLCLALVLSGCKNNTGNSSSAEEPSSEAAQSSEASSAGEAAPVEYLPEQELTLNPDMVHPQVTIEMDDGKKIVVELYPEYAPNTVANFVSLVQDGFYDGVVFHRIKPDFMIQGGDPEGTGMGGPGYEIKGEFSANGVENSLSHQRGVISMARNGISMDSAGSQFFICVGDPVFLDGDYAAFGRVLEGMDVVDEIVSGERTGAQNDQAVEPRIMKAVTVDTFGEEWAAPEKMAE